MAGKQLSVDPAHRSQTVHGSGMTGSIVLVKNNILDVVVQGWALLAQCVHEVPVYC